jgi:predicted DsbA family dithiol-disulfide isomerase
MLAKVVEAANKVGLTFKERTHTFNSRRAQEVGKWAESKGLGDEFRKAAYVSYFEKGEDISSLEVLSKICESIGLDPKEGSKTLEDATYAPAVDADWEAVRTKNIRAVPTVLMGNEALAGVQSYELLESLANKAGVAKR